QQLRARHKRVSIATGSKEWVDHQSRWETDARQMIERYHQDPYLPKRAEVLLTGTGCIDDDSHGPNPANLLNRLLQVFVGPGGGIGLQPVIARPLHRQRERTGLELRQKIGGPPPPLQGRTERQATRQAFLA